MYNTKKKLTMHQSDVIESKYCNIEYVVVADKSQVILK